MGQDDSSVARVFSAHAEVVPTSTVYCARSTGILRARGGSSLMVKK